MTDHSANKPAMATTPAASHPTTRKRPAGARHQASGRWKLGLALALITMSFWATLPVALKVALEQMDPWSLTWYRFAFSLVVVGLWLGLRGRLGVLRGLDRRAWLLLGIAGIGLTANYVFYLLGLARTTPANTQVLIQLAGFLLALGSLWLFGERYNRWQWLGFAVLISGLGLFFSDQLAALVDTLDQYLIGSYLIISAALVWVVYALVQKQLLVQLPSAAIMLVIYAMATLLLLPFADPLAITVLDSAHLLALAYCAINTLGAYSAFAEALAHWEASRVSAILAVTPLATLAFMWGLERWAPGLVAPEVISPLGIIGALMVVGGSMGTSLAGSRHRRGAACQVGERPGGLPPDPSAERADEH